LPLWDIYYIGREFPKKNFLAQDATIFANDDHLIRVSGLAPPSAPEKPYNAGLFNAFY
jgi:hypothetical protein